MSSADNFCKQFGPRSGLTKHRPWSESILFDNMLVFLTKLFENVLLKNQQKTKKHAKLTSMQRVKFLLNKKNIAITPTSSHQNINKRCHKVDMYKWTWCTIASERVVFLQSKWVGLDVFLRRDNENWSSSLDFGTYPIYEPWRLWRECCLAFDSCLGFDINTNLLTYFIHALCRSI